MTNEEQTYQTKKALSDALKQRMAHTPVSKISIRELVEDCNINRKTFYYHFQDVPALLKWTFEQDAFEVLRQFDLLIDQRDAFRFVIGYVTENRRILNCALDSVGQTELKRFFQQDFYEVVQSGIDGIARQLEIEPTASYRHFLCRMYTEMVAGMLIDAIQLKDSRDQDELLEYLLISIPASIQGALRAVNAKS